MPKYDEVKKKLKVSTNTMHNRVFNECVTTPLEQDVVRLYHLGYEPEYFPDNYWLNGSRKGRKLKQWEIAAALSENAIRDYGHKENNVSETTVKNVLSEFYERVIQSGFLEW